MSCMRARLLVAAIALGVGGYVHLKIWQHEYRHAPVREMFVANWVASLALVALLVAAAVLPALGRQLGRVVAFGGLLLAVGSLVAFALSRGPGLPTLHGTFKEHGLETTSSYVFHFGSAKAILVAESLAAVICGSLLLVGRSSSGSRLRSDTALRARS
jgi:hypothetical protein